MMEYDVLVIGAGPGGYVAAIKCAQLGMKVACVDRSGLGGTCLNVGCIPSKALLASSELFASIEGAKQHGIDVQGVKVDFGRMQDRKDKVVQKLTHGIGYLFKKNGVVSIVGEARFVDSYTVEVAGTRYKAKQFIIATGSEPMSLPFLPIDEKLVLSSTGALALTTIPKKMVIIGAGVIGLELGSVYKRLGSEVEVVEFMPKILPEFDDEISTAFQKILEKEGFKIHLNSKVTARLPGVSLTLSAETSSGMKQFSADVVLVSIGRRPVTSGLNLEVTKVVKDSRGFILIDSNFRTADSHIFAIGDVVGNPMLAHKGSEEGLAVANFIAGITSHINYAAIPNVVYTHPEIASCGFTERALKEAGIEYRSVTIPLVANSRHLATGDPTPGLIKLIIHPITTRILGCHIIAPHASELIHIPLIAFTHDLPLSALLHTTFAHPTLIESFHEAIHALTSKALHL